MSRPYKPNPTPTAPFNLRITVPMKTKDIKERLGVGYRVAQRHGDQRSTMDKDPCPHCGMPVEWALTSKNERGKTVQYVYSRCQGKQKHAWGFSNQATKRDMEIVDLSPPPPRPSAGTEAMAQWIDRKADEIAAQLKALEALKRLAAVVAVGGRPLPHDGHKH